MLMFALEVNSPTAHVNITRDITLGLSNNIKDFKKELISMLETDLFFMDFVDNF